MIIFSAFENGCLQGSYNDRLVFLYKIDKQINFHLATAKIEFEIEDSYFRIGLNTSDMIDWGWTDNSPYNYWAWSSGMKYSTIHIRDEVNHAINQF